MVVIPEDIVVIAPEWRRYKYIVVKDVICIVDPENLHEKIGWSSGRWLSGTPSEALSLIRTTLEPPGKGALRCVRHDSWVISTTG